MLGLAKKLRKVADAIEDLFQDLEHVSRPAKRSANERRAEQAITETITNNLTGAAPTRHTQRGYKYPPGAHWTQRPENKAKLTRIAKKMHAAKAGRVKHESGAEEDSAPATRARRTRSAPLVRA